MINIQQNLLPPQSGPLCPHHVEPNFIYAAVLSIICIMDFAWGFSSVTKDNSPFNVAIISFTYQKWNNYYDQIICAVQSSVSLIQKLELPEREEPQWGNVSITSSCRAFLFSDWCGRDQSIVDGSAPGQAVLSSTRTQGEQARGSKPISCVPPWPLRLLLPPGSSPACIPVLTSFMINNHVKA